MADEIRIGGGGYGPADGVPHEPDQSQLPEDSGLSQAEETEAGSQAANAKGQPAEPEEKPAAASAQSAPVQKLPQQRDDRRRLGPTTTTPRRPVTSSGSKDEKRVKDGIDHLGEVPDEVEAGEFRDPEKADSRESNSGQEGDSRLAASTEEAAPSPKATGSSASGTSTSPATTAAPSASPANIGKTSGLNRAPVQTTPAATQQTPGQAGSSSPAISKARPTPDRLKLTADGAASSLIRAKVSATKNGGNPKASLGQPLGSPASPKTVSPISLRRLPTGEVVSGQKRAVIGTSPAAEGSLVADSEKRSADGASSQLIRSRLAGNQRASLGSAAGLTQPKLTSEQMRELQDRLRRRRATVG